MNNRNEYIEYLMERLEKSEEPKEFPTYVPERITKQDVDQIDICYGQEGKRNE